MSSGYCVFSLILLSTEVTTWNMIQERRRIHVWSSMMIRMRLFRLSLWRRWRWMRSVACWTLWVSTRDLRRERRCQRSFNTFPWEPPGTSCEQNEIWWPGSVTASSHRWREGSQGHNMSQALIWEQTTRCSCAEPTTRSLFKIYICQ